MARKPEPGALIHCEYCGEDYSATYKRCPFCGEKPSANAPVTRFRREEPEDDYIFEGQELFDGSEEDEEDEPAPARPRGGKRLAQDEAAGPVNLTRLITFICSLVIIAAAVVIIFAYIYPKIHTPTDPLADNSPPGSSSVSPSEPVEPSPSESVEPTPSESVEPSAPAAVQGTITGVSSVLRVRSGPGTDYEKVTSLKNGTAVTVLSDAGDGWYQIAFADGGGQATGYVQSKYVKADGGEAAPAPAPSESTAPEPSGGTPATIVNASTGLRVRSGPGTSYDVVDSLRNGSTVNVVADAGGGWYQITFTSGGSQKTGYIMGTFIDDGSGSAASPVSPAPSATPAPTPAPSVSGRATIVNASTGLRVRSGPGTDNEVVGSLRNGSSINVVSSAGDGWYQITFTNSSGGTVTGYIMDEYFSMS